MTIKEVAVSLGFELDEKSYNSAISNIDNLVKNAEQAGHALSDLFKGGSDGASSFASSGEHAKNAVDEIAESAQAASAVMATLFAVDKIKSFAKECINVAQTADAVGRRFNKVFGASEDGGVLASNVEQNIQKLADASRRSATSLKSYETDFQNILYGLVASDGSGTTREQTAALADQMARLGVDLATMNNQSDAEVMGNMQRAVIMGNTRAANYGLYAPLTDQTREMAMNAIKTKSTGIESLDAFIKDINLTGDKYKQLSKYEQAIVNYVAIALQSVDAIGMATGDMTTTTVMGVSRSLEATRKSFMKTVGDQLIPWTLQFMKIESKLYTMAERVAKFLLIDEKGAGRLSRALEIVNGAVENASKIFNPVFNYIKYSIDGATKGLRDFANETGLVTQLLKPLVLIIGSFLSFGVIIPTISKAVGLFMSLISISPHVWLIVGAMTALGLIIEDIVVWLNGGNSLIGKMFDSMGISVADISSKALTFFRLLKEGMSNIVGKYSNSLRASVFTILLKIMNISEKIGNRVKTMFQSFGSTGLLDSVLGTFDKILSVVDKIFNYFATNDNAVGNVLGTIIGIKTAINAITKLGGKKGFLGGLSIIGNATGDVSKNLLGMFGSALGAVGGGISTFMQGTPIASFFGSLSEGILGIIKPIGFLIQGMGMIASPILIVIGVVTALALALVFLTGHAGDLIAKLQEMGVIDRAKALFDQLKNVIGSVITAILTIGGAISQFVSAHIDEITTFIGTVIDYVITAISLIMTIIQGVADFFTAIINGDFNAAAEILFGIFQHIGEFIANLFTGIFELGIQIVQWGIGAIGTAFSGIIDLVVAVFSSLAEKALEWGKRVAYNFVSSLPGGQAVLDAFGIEDPTGVTVGRDGTSHGGKSRKFVTAKDLEGMKTASPTSGAGLYVPNTNVSNNSQYQLYSNPSMTFNINNNSPNPLDFDTVMSSARESSNKQSIALLTQARG